MQELYGVKSNFTGTEFILFDKVPNRKTRRICPIKARKELGVVLYDTMLGTKGPRK